MSLSSNRGRRSRRGLMWSILFSATLLAACPARGETITAHEMLRGIDVTPEACARVGKAVWVTAYGQGFCMRYYLSTVGGAHDVPVVFLNGDRPTFDTLHENVRGKRTGSQIRRNEAQARKAKDIDTEDLAEQAGQDLAPDGKHGHLSVAHGARRIVRPPRAASNDAGTAGDECCARCDQAASRLQRISYFRSVRRRNADRRAARAPS